ncbi:MAG: hypothetical protein ACOYIG_00495 [Acetivibrionales bacterium]|jgi:hypothetical protein
MRPANSNPIAIEKKNLSRNMITERVTNMQITISGYPRRRPNLFINAFLNDKK